MAKLLSFILIAVFLGSSAHGFMTIDDFRRLIEPECYDRKDEKELINGQVSPIPNSLETFISIVERLEERYSMEKILRSFIARFRYDDLLLRYVEAGNQYEFVTRGDFKAKTAHEMLQDLFGNGVVNEVRNTDLSSDERCALYFMISHTVNDSVTPMNRDEEEIIEAVGSTPDTLKHPREQGVVNLNGKTQHAFALGKVLLGILAGLQDSEKTVGADAIYQKRKGSGSQKDYLKDLQINVLHGVTISDVVAVTIQYIKDAGRQNFENAFLPNGYWDDSVCPTKYILEDNNGCYATSSLVRGAIDGLYLGKKIKTLRETNQEIRLSQVLRVYYNPKIAMSDSSLSEITWCNRHPFFTSVQNEIIDQAVAYYQLYASLLDLSAHDQSSIKNQISQVVASISTYTRTIFDEVTDESGECGRGSPSKVCETPRNLTAVLDMKGEKNGGEMQSQIIGNLSVGFHMSPSSSSAAVYSNLRSTDGSKLHSINISDISGCASCAIKYFGVFDSVPTSIVNEVEVFRGLNRTLDRDDLPDHSDSEAGVPSKVVIYFNYGNPSNTHDLRRAINDFRNQHSGSKIFAVGSRKEALSPFVDDAGSDIYTQDVTTTLKSLQDKVCKVPALFQYENCYKNSRSDEEAHVYRGFVTPNHMQYWAMYPRYFLKSFKIQMTFATMSGQIRVCFTRNYDEMYGTRQSNMKCQNADAGKPVVFDESNPCKKYNVYNCRPFYFSIEGLNVPDKKCTDKKCRTPNQIEFEFKHTGISCNRGISFASMPMTLVVALFTSMYFVFKH